MRLKTLLMTSFICMFTSLHAQSTRDIVMPLLYQGNEDIFFKSLVERGKLISAASPESELNDVFQCIFKEYYRGNDSVTVVIPDQVTVYRYDMDIRPVLGIDSVSREGGYYFGDIYALKEKENPSAISMFTPHLDIENEVIYLEKNVEILLNRYVGERPESYADKAAWLALEEKLDALSPYISVRTPWDTVRVVYESLPLIKEMYVGNDGVCMTVYMSHLSIDLFIPWAGDPIKIGYGIS